MGDGDLRPHDLDVAAQRFFIDKGLPQFLNRLRCYGSVLQPQSLQLAQLRKMLNYRVGHSGTIQTQFFKVFQIGELSDPGIGHARAAKVEKP